MPVVPGRAVPVAFSIAQAARDGEKAAVAAVAGARSLSHADQFLLFVTIGEWGGRDPLPEARATLAAIRREWARLRLAETPPEIQETDVNWAEEAQRHRQVQYMTPHGQPAGRIPWLQR